jgi:RNA recognition motif-containing protein
MDESFLRRALHLMGEDNIVSIKVMRNKMTGETANYGFINFENDYSALLAMHKLNQKFIPNTNPVRP